MPILLDLFLTFFKIGIVSFGGGYAMIPLVTEEALRYGFTSEQIINFIAVAESTPGPIAINMATFIGSTKASILGSMLATLGVVLPSFIIILIIASIMQGLMQFGGVKAFLNGIRPIVIGLIIGTAITLVLTVIFSISSVYDALSFDWKAMVIFVLIASIAITFKKIKKKAISPILLIIISAILGLIFYGLII
ncbi:MAG: chromate transporter [Clostridiales bacterium]|nr:chromate transporter [Clostridiales bacterium]